MKTVKSFAAILPSIALTLTLFRPSAAASQEAVEFFEAKIRPLLIDNCYECHSEGKKVKGGLRLDHRAGWEQGGDSGPAIVPGRPDESLLIKAVRYHDPELQMPPKDKRLAAEQVQVLVEWVAMGAPDPRTGEAFVQADPGSDHWAFQPVSDPAPPAVRNRRWPTGNLDRFILATLEDQQLSPSPRADARTLIRRVFYDVTGLPPTPEEAAAFEADPSPAAYARLVDDLLGRPQFGERWARHWLDIARYADTKGYVFEEERKYAFAYTFRDYVVQALNDDKPFDRFLTEQLAADHLELGSDKRPLAAMGYLTLGRRFLNNQHDIIDDRIDVVTRGMMGLTVACARCHDHKYDPVPTADYYSLYGVFASSHEPGEKPLLGVEPPQFAAYLEEKNKRVKERDDFIAETNEAIRRKLNGSVGTYLLAAHDAEALTDGGLREALAKKRNLDNGVLGRWITANEGWATESNPIFLPWNLARKGVTNAGEDLAGRLAEVLAEAGERVHPLVRDALAKAESKSLEGLAGAYDRLFARVDAQWQEASKADEPPAALGDADAEWLRQVLYAKGAPNDLNDGDLRRIYDVPQGQKARRLQRLVEELEATHPGAPPRAMVLLDNAKPTEPRIFKRGQPGMPGDAVPRRFLEVLSSGEREPFTKGSGRLELAKAIASTNNPLTARVFVNRVWAQYMGAPLVGTPSDFGVRSDPPSHPELLDHLAWKFMHEDGWSVKGLHRRILLSAAYQQASIDLPRNRARDPGNRYYWRQNRKRLDFEGMRDSLLAIAGNLDSTMGGQAVSIEGADYAPRRSLYGFIDRQNLPGMFRTFDLASPDTTSPGRFTTTVPQQALFLMNSPFIARQSRELASRLDLDGPGFNPEAVKQLYRRVFQREPRREEMALARRFLAEEIERSLPEPPAPDWQYGFGEWDEPSGRLKGFTPLAHFANDQWTASAKLPDPEHGWVVLNRDGGHPGNDLTHAVVRRWTAPADGQLTLTGKLKHSQEAGDGVRARVATARGVIGAEWIAHNAERVTELKPFPVSKGEHLDLVVDCRTGPNSDSFEWKATIRYERGMNESGEVPRGEWSTASQFAGPVESEKPLEAWERYAQVLLVSNEVFFVD